MTTILTAGCNASHGACTGRALVIVNCEDCLSMKRFQDHNCKALVHCHCIDANLEADLMCQFQRSLDSVSPPLGTGSGVECPKKISRVVAVVASQQHAVSDSGTHTYTHTMFTAESSFVVDRVVMFLQYAMHNHDASYYSEQVRITDLNEAIARSKHPDVSTRCKAAKPLQSADGI